MRYFTQKSKLRGTIIFLMGFFLVFTGHPIPGLALEVFGFLNLFGNMLPMVGAMAKNLPFVSDIVGSSSNRGGGRKRSSPSGRGRRRDDYNEDYFQEDYQGGGGYYDDGYGRDKW